MMTQDSVDGPLSAAELEKGARRMGRPEIASDDAPGHTLPASDSADQPEGDRGPNPIAGTMLPPD